MKRLFIVLALLLLGICGFAQDLAPIPTGHCRIVVYAEYWTPLWNGLKTPAQITVDQTNRYELVPLSSYLVIDVPTGRHVIAGEWKAALAKDPDTDGLSFFLGEGKTMSMKFKIYNGSARFILQPGEPPQDKIAKLSQLNVSVAGGKK